MFFKEGGLVKTDKHWEKVKAGIMHPQAKGHQRLLKKIHKTLEEAMKQSLKISEGRNMALPTLFFFDIFIDYAITVVPFLPLHSTSSCLPPPSHIPQL